MAGKERERCRDICHPPVCPPKAPQLGWARPQLELISPFRSPWSPWAIIPCLPDGSAGSWCQRGGAESRPRYCEQGTVSSVVALTGCASVQSPLNVIIKQIVHFLCLIVSAEQPEVSAGVSCAPVRTLGVPQSEPHVFHSVIAMCLWLSRTSVNINVSW